MYIFGGTIDNNIRSSEICRFQVLLYFVVVLLCGLDHIISFSIFLCCKDTGNSCNAYHKISVLLRHQIWARTMFNLCHTWLVSQLVQKVLIFTGLSHAMVKVVATLDIFMSDIAVGQRGYSWRPRSLCISYFRRKIFHMLHGSGFSQVEKHCHRDFSGYGLVHMLSSIYSLCCEFHKDDYYIKILFGRISQNRA